MRKLTFALLLCSLALGTHAQQGDSLNRWRFSTTLSAGYVAGQAGPDFSAEAIAGARRKGLFLGAGAGVDYYTFRSVPLFLHVRQDLRRQYRTPYLYLSGGPSLPWLREGDQIAEFWESPGRFRQGPFWEGGLGFSFALKKYQALSVSAGYSYKMLTEKRTETAPCFAPPCPQYDRYFTYDLRRIAVRAGWRLF